MNKFQLKDLEIDWFLLVSGFGSLLTGTVLANNRPGEWDLISFFSTVIFWATLYLLQRTARRLSTPLVIDDTRLATGKRRLTVIDYLPGFGLLAVIFVCFYFLLKQGVLIGINLVWISLISIVVFVQNSRVAERFTVPMSWLFKSIVISPLLLVLGISVQAVDINGTEFLFALSLFSLMVASFLAMEFQKYSEAPSEQKKTLIPSIGIESTIRLHRVTILISYAALVVYLYLTGSLRTNWAMMLVSLISFLQMFLLYRISLGMKPNYTLIKASAYMQTLSFVYLFIFNTILI